MAARVGPLVLAGVLQGVRDLDERFSAIRRGTGAITVNGYTVINAALGNDGAKKRIRTTVEALPKKIVSRDILPVKARQILAAIGGNPTAAKLVRKGAHQLTIYLGTRPMVLRSLALAPGPP